MHRCLQLVSAAGLFSLQSVQLLIGATFLPARPHLTLWCACVFVCVSVRIAYLIDVIQYLQHRQDAGTDEQTHLPADVTWEEGGTKEGDGGAAFGFNETTASGVASECTPLTKHLSCGERLCWFMPTKKKGCIKSHLINLQRRRLSSARLFRSSEPQRRCRGPGSCLWKQNKARKKVKREEEGEKLVFFFTTINWKSSDGRLESVSKKRDKKVPS